MPPPSCARLLEHRIGLAIKKICKRGIGGHVGRQLASAPLRTVKVSGKNAMEEALNNWYAFLPMFLNMASAISRLNGRIDELAGSVAEMDAKLAVLGASNSTAVKAKIKVRGDSVE